MKIAVAMSGGIDSSVAAALLKQQGHEIFGITMNLCSTAEKTAGAHKDAAAVALHLGIPHHTAHLAHEFHELIIGDFINEYIAGKTPNPCARCNRFIKFGLLLNEALKLGADFLATGHYARITIDPDGSRHLRAARDKRKDQSYFLYALPSQNLEYIMFPLGKMESKDETRRLARQFGLPSSEKKDSQEICFIPDYDYVSYLEGHAELKIACGDIVHVSGNVLGKHNGSHRYTIGQRKRLGIAWSEPLYVLDIDAEKNIVVVGEEPFLYSDGLIGSDLNWLVESLPVQSGLTCKIRYRHQALPCRIAILENDRFSVQFEEPVRAITPGQSVVFYNGDEVLGGGIIISSTKSDKLAFNFKKTS